MRMQYTPFASDVELPFYTALASRKINHDKLDDSPHHILGLYEIRPTDPPNVSCRVQVHGNALTNDKLVYLHCIQLPCTSPRFLACCSILAMSLIIIGLPQVTTGLKEQSEMSTPSRNIEAWIKQKCWNKLANQ